MLQDAGQLFNTRNEYYSSHYFDNEGRPHAADPSVEFNPQSITISLKDGRKVDLFLLNNPWRALSEGGMVYKDSAMVYQYCVFCKEKRFENESFSGSESKFQDVENITSLGKGECLFTCRKLSCLAEKWFDLTDNIAKDKYYSIFSFNGICKLPEIISKEKC